MKGEGSLNTGHPLKVTASLLKWCHVLAVSFTLYVSERELGIKKWMKSMAIIVSSLMEGDEFLLDSMLTLQIAGTG